MKRQILFSGKNKKNNIILSSAENAQRVVKVKLTTIFTCSILNKQLRQRSKCVLFAIYCLISSAKSKGVHIFNA